MSAEGRAKLWAREKTEQLSPKPRPERKPFHGIRAAREALTAPRFLPQERMTDSEFAREQRRSEQPKHAWELFDSYGEEDPTDTLSETHPVADGERSPTRTG